MTPTELEDLLTLASERGARRALESVGLHDATAGADIHDLRTLIESWRAAKRTALEAFVKWTTVACLGALVAGVYINFKK